MHCSKLYLLAVGLPCSKAETLFLVGKVSTFFFSLYLLLRIVALIKFETPVCNLKQKKHIILISQFKHN